MKDVKEIFEEYQSQLMAIDGVFGVAIGAKDGKKCIQVHLNYKAVDSEQLIPTEVEGYPIVIIKMPQPKLQ